LDTPGDCFGRQSKGRHQFERIRAKGSRDRGKLDVEPELATLVFG
jgi:hypothetical protein